MRRERRRAVVWAAVLIAAAAAFASLSGGARYTESAGTTAPARETGVILPEPSLTPPRPTDAPEPERTPAPVESAAPSPEESEYAPDVITVAVGGDVLPMGRIGAKIEAGEYDAVLDPDTAARLRAADATMINLETSVSVRGEPVPDKAYTFRSPPENLKFLTDWLGVDVVSIANNHTLDYGWDAFYDTMTHLDEYGIARIGAGANIAEAARPYIAETGGVRIAFFAANQILTYASWTAGEDKPGQLIARDAKNLGALGEAMARVRDGCDYIVVYMHWGIELDVLPYGRQTEVARALIDAGADVVIGAHPHVIQSFEYYNSKPIVYSVGNFLFNALHPDTAVVFLRFGAAETSVTVEVMPARTEGTLTRAIGGDDRRRLLDYWGSISPGVTFDDDGIMREETPAPDRRQTGG
ncbi:MAG: CapA family protein [Oscillospiraceae bacterium]|jgi:poly-gamma-glutamate synthesis protein (capsule biosynthesis protein)|nr:CapA family protein [Oscillospiraceae bacterium]